MYSRRGSCYWVYMGDLKLGMSDANEQRTTYIVFFALEKPRIFHRDIPTCTSVRTLTKVKSRYLPIRAVFSIKAMSALYSGSGYLQK